MPPDAGMQPVIDWFWTCAGKALGYRKADALFSCEGTQIGHFKGDEIYGRDGNYLGEIGRKENQMAEIGILSRKRQTSRTTSRCHSREC
jgi:hypothetical protein